MRLFNRIFNSNNLQTIIIRIIMLVMVVILIIAIMPLWETLIDKIIIPTTSEYHQFHIALEVAILILVVSALVLSLYNIIQNRGIPVSWKTYNFAVVLLGVYVYYRYLFEKWHYYTLFGSKITYVDLIALFLIIIASVNLFYLCSKKRTVTTQITSLFTDQAITSEDDDELNRGPFAKNLMKHISTLDVSKGAYSIAILSPWGNGKTSFINLIYEIADKQKDDFVIVRFSPWHLSPSTVITKKFFQQVSAKLGGIDYRLSRLLDRYYDLIKETDANIFMNVVDATRRRLHNSASSELLNEISQKLKASNKKLLILIDDIDRLNGSEIEEIFRIIRGSANFPHFIFISAFDKRYVQNALQDHIHAKTEHYIEKFFEVEFNLPEYDKKTLSKIILEKVKEFLSDEDYKDFEKYISPKSIIFETKLVYGELSNLRNIYRWLNNIKLKYEILKGECLITDLADLELLYLLYPEIYELLKADYDKFLYNEHNSYILWSQKNLSDKDWYNRLHPHKDLREEPAYKTATQNGDGIKDILERLLPEHKFNSLHRAFANPAYIDRYFYCILQHSELSYVEFNNLISGSFEEIKGFIDKDSEGQYANSIRLHVNDVTQTNKDNVKNILDLIFYSPLKYKRFGFSIDTILEYVNLLPGDHSSRKKYLLDLLFKNGVSYYVSILFSANSHDRYRWHDYFNDPECDGIVIEMLSYAIQEKLAFSDIREFYFKTVKYQRGVHNTLTGECEDIPVFNPKADDLLKCYMAQSFIHLISALIWEDHMHDGNLFMPSGDFMRLWKNWEGFEQYCSENNINIDVETNQNKINEFKKFISDYLESGEKSIQFKFKEIDVKIQN